MATQTPIATDSAAELKGILGDDATANFENDPKFMDTDPAASASSENVAVQRDADDAVDSDEEEEELEDEDEDELEDEDIEDEDDDDVEPGEDEEVDEEEGDDEDEVGVAA